MKQYIFKVLGIAVLSFSLVSCDKNLDLYPTNDVTPEVVYSTPEGYKQSLAKIYGTMALTGNQGPAGAPDVYYPGSDEGQNADFFRTYWNAQELSTDEAITAWGDPGLPDFHALNTAPSNLFLHGVYYKSMYQVAIINEFIRQSTDEKLGSRGITGADAEEIRQYRPEVRFLRAFDYWVMMDLFGNPPFATEADLVGGPNPRQIQRAELFEYIESELLDIESQLKAPRTHEYGRADQAAAWALLARLYLNAAVYTGTPKWSEAATYAKKVIDAGYGLLPDYRHLLLADNNTGVSGGTNPEFIFTINYDGLRTQGFGGTTFLIKGGIGPTMSAADYGMNEGWGGHRTTKAFVDKFADPSGATDKRAQFFTAGHTVDIAAVATFSNGYAVTKYRNKKRNGTNGSDLIYSDVDVPVFRLAEMYLIYAEAVKRGGTGDANLALTYVNNLRQRAYGNASGNIVANDLTVDFILDERARELYWEGHRRTDLIRYNKFTTADYLWPWKGGVASGTGVAATKSLYPLPSADLNANRNLVQNPGY
jgi:hypothetical protein